MTPLLTMMADITEGYSEVREVEIGLIALFPLVTMVSAFLLKGEARNAVKRVVPLVVAFITAALYFLIDVFPGWGPDLVVEIGALVALANKFYDSFSGVIELASKRTLDEAIPGGIVE